MSKQYEQKYVERINILCALHGISQSKLASDLGISKQLLNNCMKGKSKFSDVVRLGLLRYFDIQENIFTDREVHLTVVGNKLEQFHMGIIDWYTRMDIVAYTEWIGQQDLVCNVAYDKSVLFLEKSPKQGCFTPEQLYNKFILEKSQKK